MHHTASMYSGAGMESSISTAPDGYGQTAISLVGDGSSSSLVPDNTSCSYFNGQTTNVITDSWPTMSYANGLNPMKQMEGEDRVEDQKLSTFSTLRFYSELKF